MIFQKKLALILLLAGIVIITGWLISSSQLSFPSEKFGIYLLEKEVVISDNEIITYNMTSHEIRLNQEGIAKIKSLDLIQEPFVAKINGRIIYNGTFWSDIFSVPSSGIVLTDIIAIQQGLTDIVRVEQCYHADFCGIDQRNDSEMFEHFDKLGKLIQ